MDLAQQVKNAMATLEMSKPRKPFVAEDKATEDHRRALQMLSNGQPVPYSQTLRIVTHDGSRAMMQEQPSKRHPGYSRNALGGFFTN